MTPPLRIAIGQLQMHWTIEANMAALQRAIAFAAAQGAQVCCFSELAVTGFHRQIAALAKPALVQPCLEALARSARQHRIAVAVGAPQFPGDGRILNSHVLLDETGAVAVVVDKIGLTAPEATFFAAGSGRPVGRLQGWRCSAVICREVEDLDDVALQLLPGAAQLLFWPGLMSPDPDKPPMDPPEHVQQAQRLARRTGAWVVQANWPNALNYPETSPGTGRSVVIAPDGNILLALPPAAPGVGVFNLGSSTLNWHAEESLTP